MREALAFVSAIALAAALTGCDTKDTSPAPAPDEAAADAATPSTATSMTEAATAADFVEMAAQANMIEVEAGKLAQTNATRADVKDFARMMVRDHAAAGEGLKAAAGGEIVPTTLDAAHQAKLTELQAADDFDRAYLDLQVKAHEQAVDLFESYARDGDDAELAAFATETLPTLRSHLTEVRDLAADAGGGAPGLAAGDAVPDNDTPDVPVSSPTMRPDPTDPTIEPPNDPLTPESTPNTPEDDNPPVPPGP